MENDRPTASSTASSTAAQKSPGAACVQQGAGRSRARTRTAHDDRRRTGRSAGARPASGARSAGPCPPRAARRAGSSCAGLDSGPFGPSGPGRPRDLGDRPRTRRPVPATRRAPARDDAHLAGGEAAGEVELVRGEHHRAARRPARRRTTSSSTSRPCSSRPAWGSSSSSRRGLRASALASERRRRWPCDRRPCATFGDALQADPFERGVGVGGAVPGRPGDEADVLGDGEVVVAEGLVTDERDGAAHPPGFDRQIHTEHFSLPRAQRQQPRAEPQQRGLARTVRPAEQHDLAGLDLEVGTGERGKSSEHADGRPKAYAAQPELRGPGVRYERKLTEQAGEPGEPGRPPRAGAGSRPVRSPACDVRSRASAGRW